MQAKSLKLTFLLILMLLLVSGCTLTGVTTSTQVPVDAIYTAAAQTLQAQLTQSAAEQPPTSTPLPPQPPTDTPPPPPPVEALPTDTPAPLFTDTPFPTAAPSVPVAVIDNNSNCRSGPSPAYDPPVAVLRRGDRADILGRNSDRSWWYVQVPGRETKCWVWGDNVSVEGDTGNVPVVQPPAPPPRPTATRTQAASFDASFDNIHTCGGDPYVIFELDNNSNVDFESMRLEIVDTDEDDEIFDSSSDAPFMGAGDECPPGGDVFPDGKTFWVGGNIEDLGTGNDAEATITLCTEDDLEGTCVSEEVDFNEDDD